MIYFINYCYKPNTAAINRTEAFIRTLAEKGMKITWVFIMASPSLERFEKQINNVSIRYLWTEQWSKSKIAKRIYVHFSFMKFLTSLHHEDVIYMYGCIAFAKSIVRSRVTVFHEMTENPEVVIWPSKVNFKEYYRACSRMSALFVISEPLKEHYVKNGCNANNITVLNMTVDPSRFTSCKKEDALEKYIAYCGTIYNNKDGVDDLIKSFSIVVNTHNNYKLYIIGPTPSLKDAEENLKLIEKLNIKDNVVFTGVVPSDDMPQLLMGAEALVLARPDSIQARCGFPTKLGEYLMTGKPVVITKTGDIPKFLEDGYSALLCTERNINEIASKILWAIEHPVESNIIGKRGKEVALLHFNCNNEVNKIFEKIKFYSNDSTYSQKNEK